ncbi:MAG: type 1 glutamine amidotransferase [Phycisphaeraceae bacterium]|nr:type 1 glutamine amidotransferase [Phycisphaeraceae bacterium]
MAIIVFQHGGRAVGPGRLGLTLRDHGFRLDVRTPHIAGAPGVPADLDNVEGVVVLGGEQNVTDIADLPWMQAEADFIRSAHARQLPVLGICLGHQLIAHALGGTVAPAATPEWGFTNVTVQQPGQTETMLAGVPWDAMMFQAHNQEVATAPPGATVLASSAACKVQVFKAGLRTYGFQHHFECDRPMIEVFMKGAPGGPPADLSSQLDARYDVFARIAERLCINIAAYVFPLSRRMTA